MFGRFLLTLLGVPLICAASLPPVGQPAKDAIELLGKTVPLPPGDWQVAANGFGQTGDQEPGPYGVIGGVLLVRPAGDDGEFLLVHTNALPVRSGWGQPPECAAGAETLFQSVGEPRNLHNACSFVVAERRGALLRSRLPALGGPDDAARLTAALPSWALITGLRVSDRRDMLDIRYGVAPRRPDPASWFDAVPPTDVAHRTTVKELGDWAQRARAPALAGLRAPAGQAPTLPALALGAPPTVAAPEEQITAARLSLYKLATYRVPSTFFGLAVSTFAVGSVTFGAWISFWQMATHSAVFVANELAWEWPGATAVVPIIATPPSPPEQVQSRAEGGALAGLVQVAANSPGLPQGAASISAVFVTDGKQVPLPTGRWIELATTTENGVAGTVLGQVEDSALRGLVVVHSNTAPTGAILGPSAECGRSDVLFAVTRFDTPEDGFCTYAKRVMPMLPDERAMHDNRLWAMAAQKLADSGVSVPKELLMAGARARTQQNFLDARYYFVPPVDSRRAALELEDWSELVQEPLELGVRGRLRAEERALPWPWDGRAVWQETVAQTDRPLSALAAAGAIAPDVLARHRAAAEQAMTDREQQRLSLWGRSFLKVASYRVLAYIDTVAVQTFFTGSPTQGVAVASAHAVFKPFLAYGNELFWASSGHGKAAATLLTANFPEIGTDR